MTLDAVVGSSPARLSNRTLGGQAFARRDCRARITSTNRGCRPLWAITTALRPAIHPCTWPRVHATGTVGLGGFVKP